METYFFGAYWGDRRESVERCAERVEACLAALAKCDDAFGRWFQPARSRQKALEQEFPATAERIKERLLHGRNRRDVGGDMIEDLGFSLSLWNGGKDSEDMNFSVHCGASTGNPSLGNSCVVNLPSEGRPGERLLRVDPLICLVRAVAESFDPDWATIMPDSLLQKIQLIPNKPRPGWLFYAANRLAPLFHIPPTIRSVHIPNRGNIAVVTEEQFSTQRSEHLSARDAIEKAMTSPAAQP